MKTRDNLTNTDKLKITTDRKDDSKQPETDRTYGGLVTNSSPLASFIRANGGVRRAG